MLPFRNSGFPLIAWSESKLAVATHTQCCEVIILTLGSGCLAENPSVCAILVISLPASFVIGDWEEQGWLLVKLILQNPAYPDHIRTMQEYGQ